MKAFQSLGQRITHWANADQGPLTIAGTALEEWSFILRGLLEGEASLAKKNILIVTGDVEEAERCYAALKGSILSHELLFYPGLEQSPYSSIVSSESALLYRFSALAHLVSHDRPCLLVTSIEAYLLKSPTKSFFVGNRLDLIEEDIISPLELASKLVDLGYESAPSVEEPGTFCSKGEIFDIYPLTGGPIRLHYFDDLIEKIHPIDLATGKTRKEITIKDTKIYPTPRIFRRSEFQHNLRESIPMPAPGQKAKYEKRRQVFEKLSHGQLFEEYPAYCPLFLEESESLDHYFPLESALTIFFNPIKVSSEGLTWIDQISHDYEVESQNAEGDVLLPAPESLYLTDVENILTNSKALHISEVDIGADFETDLAHKVTIRLEPAKSYLGSTGQSKAEFIKEAMENCKKRFMRSGHILFCYSNDSAKNEFNHLLDVFEFSSELRSRIHYIPFKLTRGFYYENEDLLILSDGDLFSVKTQKIKSRPQKDLDLFAEQLASLKEGDYVIHSDHGVGKYLGLEKIQVGETSTDFLILEYSGKDKVYVPIYKLNLIQKHADAAAELKPDSLRTNKFKTIKARAKTSAKKLAFDLIKLQAERESTAAYAFSPPDDDFREFELSFPFQETPDQLAAIRDVVDHMQKSRPMDYLVCGDVGFGKTEVAIRAAFKAVLDHKQVAVLVPTTVLALQHFNSFERRLNGFPVRVEFLSRFKSPSESKKIKEDLEAGKIDIIIGTHKLLSDSIKYKDLGLVIVDEEQRFGVGHKEKLKLLKVNVDFLTLTATPIPRTLQLAFLGLRDLSLIRTAPPKRQSIKTYVIKEDDATLQAAIRKELSRGGQVFIVHNKVHDIEDYTGYIRQLVPDASIVYAHGQLPERELEKRMKEFYDGKFQILISTTIIESGIDIPNANTMIIDRADTFGLSQLHQLRGRIGRSDKKAYAFFIIPNTRMLSTVAEKRLKALQTYAEMGSGFNIASADLEIRGAGDILGGQQSGHIEAVGLELYMELLKEAIGEIRGERKVMRRDIEFNTPFAAFIPNNYIKDSSERLKSYKRLSNCFDGSALQQIKEEFEDVYGVLPSELINLFSILEARLSLQYCGVKSVQCSDHNINLRFDKEMLESNDKLRNKIVEYFVAYPKQYSLTPDYQVLYRSKFEVTPTVLVEFCQHVAEQIVPKE